MVSGRDGGAPRSESTLLLALVDHVPAMLGYWDASLRCRFANRDYRRWFGVEPDALIGMHISALLGPDLYARNLPYIEGALRGELQVFEREIPDPSGGPPRTSEARYVPDVVDGVVHGFFVLVVDVSARKHAEDARRELDRRASEGLRGLARLAGGLAHEINNPLTVTLGALDLLLADLDEGSVREPASRREVLTDARSAAQRIAQITEGMKLLAIGRDDRRASVDVDATLASSLTLAANAYRYRAVLESDLGARCAVRADASQLSHAIVQLVINAAEAMPPRPIRENVIRVRSRTDGERVEISVEDTGRGIPADVRARMFEPFFTTKAVGEGVGLGLPIALSIVQALDGTLEHDAQAVGVTRFRVRLPVAASAEAVPPRPSPRSAPRERPRIVVVDDDAAVTRAIARMMRNDWDVSVENDPERALGLLSGGVEVDLVLSDLMMPHLHGGELYRLVVAARPELRDRFVFMTGGAFDDEVRAFLAEQQPLVVTKPFETRALLAQIEARLVALGACP